jgi:GT2 family glycosyltransferase
MGRVRSGWNPLKFKLIEPGDRPLRCDTVNGNCVLIPRDVMEEVGHIDPSFTHGIGDFDFGLRAVRMGCGLWITPGHVGSCRRNDTRGTWLDPTIGLAKRLRMVNDVKAFPLRERVKFARRHTGVRWFMYPACAYASVVWSWMRNVFRPRATPVAA